MSHKLETRLAQINLKVKNIDPEKKTISVTGDDINFMLGACEQLLVNQKKIESFYSKEVQRLNAEVEKRKADYDHARKYITAQGNFIQKFRQVMNQVRLLKFYFPRRGLSLELESFNEAERKFKSFVF